MTLETMRREAAEEGYVVKRVRVGDRMMNRWTTKCVCCGAERAWPWSLSYPPHQLNKLIELTDWTQTKKGPVCPTCQEEAPMTKVESPLINPKLQRRVYELLGENFDEDRRLYRAGWSDARIAKEADTSEQYVATVRKGAYGELAEDPAVSALKGEIEGLRKEAAALSEKLLSEMDTLEKKIEGLQQRIFTLANKRVA